MFTSDCCVFRKVKRMSLSSGSGSDVVRKEDAYVQDIACRVRLMLFCMSICMLF